jgi:hypothetical protein
MTTTKPTAGAMRAARVFCTNPADSAAFQFIASVIDQQVELPELIAALRRAQQLVRLLTVRQVIAAGDDAIDAAGLNPYCINEGQASGDERISVWWIEAAIAKAEGR